MSVVVTNGGAYEWTFYSYDMMSIMVTQVDKNITNLAYIHVLVERRSRYNFKIFSSDDICVYFTKTCQKVNQFPS